MAEDQQGSESAHGATSRGLCRQFTAAVSNRAM
jgi:hypothetical protein